ncbi:MAG: hypothetical protein KDA31_00305 [Phycisphaerales bacterium]|nr:hypothetical protein [Phycisphaerales bacterium]MCB9835988.1 hypothetical protein [Phycisphaera sp.]
MGQRAEQHFDSFDDQFDDDAFETADFADPADELDEAVSEELDELLAMGGDVPGISTPDNSPKLANSEQRYQGPDRRKSVVDTRTSGLERRRGPGRRLTDFVKAAEEGEMNAEQFLFLKAIETFKAANNKHYPNWTDVLEVVRLLGYRKTGASELNLPGVDDWTEKADSPSNVRTREGITHKRKRAA